MHWANLPSLWPPTHLGFWIALGLPAIVLGYALVGYWRRRVFERLGGNETVAAMAASVSRPRRLVKAVLVVTGYTLALGAFLRPQSEGKAELVKSVGLDIVICLDMSKSMYARDVPPSRLERAKEELGHFLDTLSGDRVGLVVFAGEVMSLPLTTDYNAVRLFYEDLTPADMPVGGTAIGKAVAAAVRMLQRARRSGPPRAQVIILLTDGEDTVSDPLAAAKEAKKLGIRIYALGIGSASGDIVPKVLEDGTEAGQVTDEKGHPVVSRLDEKTLLKMTEMTGGAYFRATAASFGMDKLARAMKDLKRAETKAKMVRHRIEEFHWLLWPALFLLLVELVVGERRRRGSWA